jgi:hypothetical protein
MITEDLRLWTVKSWASILSSPFSNLEKGERQKAKESRIGENYDGRYPSRRV